MARETGFDILHFYQGGDFITLKQAERTLSIFRNSEIPLAERVCINIDKASLLMADSKTSVLQASRQGKLEPFAYTAYGHLQREFKAPVLLGFNGERRESETGWYLLGNGYRAYSPSLMRFLASDSWSPFGKGGLNAYGYCAGDPANSVDPNGHMAVNRPRRRPVILTVENPPPQTAQHLNHVSNRQRLRTASETQVTQRTPPVQQPRANRNPLANAGGRMPFEERRTPRVSLHDIVTQANQLNESTRHLARAQVNLPAVHDPIMRADYLDSLASIRNAETAQRDNLNRDMISWFNA